MHLSRDQLTILNNLSKYDPAWRFFANSHGVRLGDLLNEHEDSIIDHEGRIADVENNLGISSFEYSFSPSSPIEYEIALEGSRRLFETSIFVTEGFNSLATLEVKAGSQVIAPVEGSDLADIGLYIYSSNIQTTDSIKLFFNFNGSATGSGRVLIR